MSHEDVANQALTSIRFRLASKQSYAKPKAMPLEEGKILSDKDPWPSPTVPGIINSWLAVEWLVARRYSDPKPKFEAPWWSRLVPKHGILTNRSTHDSYLCLFTGKWGVVTMDMEVSGFGCWSPKLVSGSIMCRRVTQHDDWNCCPVETCHGGGKIKFRPTGDVQSLLFSSLMARRTFSIWELIEAWLAVGPDPGSRPDVAKLSEKVLLTQLVHHMFRDSPDEVMAAVLDRYERPPPDDSNVDDKEVELLLEEMAISDHANCDDLKNYKDELKQKKRSRS